MLLQTLGMVSGKWPILFKIAKHDELHRPCFEPGVVPHTNNLLLLAGENSTTEPSMLQYLMWEHLNYQISILKYIYIYRYRFLNKITF